MPGLGSSGRKLRRRDRLAACGLGLAVGLVCVTAGVAPAWPAGFAVGQQWQYRHEGPRPGSIEPNAIDGERILRVVSMHAAPDGPEWVIEEQFTNNRQVVGRFSVDREGLLTTLEIQNAKGRNVQLRYDPPVPYQPVDMNVGDARTIETTLRLDGANFAMPNTTVVERLADETVSTPAGQFRGCAHFKRTTTSTVDIKIARIPVTEQREQWYHPSVAGLVKEVYRRGSVKFLGWSRPGYTATSTLVACAHEAADADMVPAALTDREPNGPRPPVSVPPPGVWRPSGLQVLAAGAALVTGILVLARWARRRRGDRPGNSRASPGQTGGS
jgi:hypothetical protein